MSLALTFLVNLLVNLAKSWIGEQERTKETELAGASKQALATEEQANAKITEVATVVNAVKPLTAIELLSRNSTNDPDFRD